MGEIEETDGEAAEEDGEVEPGEEGAFVCEEDFGFDADGEGDAFCGGGREEGLGGHCCFWKLGGSWGLGIVGEEWGMR